MALCVSSCALFLRSLPSRFVLIISLILVAFLFDTGDICQVSRPHTHRRL
jgi:hypothetical protein